MKYIVTSIFVDNKSRHVFFPAHDVEVFDTYVGALRWMVEERRISQRVEDKVVLNWNKSACQYGREWLLELTEYHASSHTIVTLSRINENGFH